MKTTEQLAKHVEQVYFGGNWTWSDLKTNLEDINLKQATTQVLGLNTIATLTYHIHYFVNVQLNLLKNGVLEGKDAESFSHPHFKSDDDWQGFKEQIFSEAKEYISLLAKIEDVQLQQILIEEKYGTYFRNILGLIEHTHYHLGQIALIKKLLANGEAY